MVWPFPSGAWWDLSALGRSWQGSDAYTAEAFHPPIPATLRCLFYKTNSISPTLVVQGPAAHPKEPLSPRSGNSIRILLLVWKAEGVNSGFLSWPGNPALGKSTLLLLHRVGWMHAPTFSLQSGERLFKSQAQADVRRHDGSLMKGSLKYSWLLSRGEVREKKKHWTPNSPKIITTGLCDVSA